jgi:hypothetical protein
MKLKTALSKTQVLALTFTIVSRESLKLQRELLENTLRGAFGNYFRQLVCIETASVIAAIQPDNSVPTIPPRNRILR